MLQQTPSQVRASLTASVEKLDLPLTWLGRRMDTSSATVRKKLNGESDWTFVELCTLGEILRYAVVRGPRMESK